MIINAAILLVCVLIAGIHGKLLAIVVHAILLDILTLIAYIIYIIVCSAVGHKLNQILKKNLNIDRILSLNRNLSGSKSQGTSNSIPSHASHVSSSSISSSNSFKKQETLQKLRRARNLMFCMVLFFIAGTCFTSLVETIIK